MAEKKKCPLQTIWYEKCLSRQEIFLEVQNRDRTMSLSRRDTIEKNTVHNVRIIRDFYLSDCLILLLPPSCLQLHRSLDMNKEVRSSLIASSHCTESSVLVRAWRRTKVMSRWSQKCTLSCRDSEQDKYSEILGNLQMRNLSRQTLVMKLWVKHFYSKNGDLGLLQQCPTPTFPAKSPNLPFSN